MPKKTPPPIGYSAIAFHDGLRQSPGLSDAAVRLALVLSGYADGTGRCWPSQSRLAHDLEWSLAKVKRTIQQLQRVGIVEYERRARHRGEKSSIRLITGITVGTGIGTHTGIKGETGIKNSTGTGIKDDTQNSPMELTQFLAGADFTAPPNGKGSLSSAPRTTQAIVAHAATTAATAGLTLTDDRKKRIGKEVRELLKAGADAETLREAVRVLVMENKSPRHLQYVLNDLIGGEHVRPGKPRGNHRTDPAEGRSRNGEY